MADLNSPQAMFVKISGGWRQIDGIDPGPSYIKVAGTWRQLSEAYIKINGVWKQVYTITAPGATTLTSRAFVTGGIDISWTNPSGVWKQTIARAPSGGSYTNLVFESTTISTSYSDTSAAALGVGTVGSSMSNPVNGSTTNVQGTRYFYRITNYDNFGHTSELVIDMLRGRVASPLFVRSTDSATWRGSAFRADTTVQAVDGGYTRCIQGYTATGMNYGHHWYGGTGNGIINNCFSNSLLPTCTAAEFMGCRDAGGIGDGSGGVKPVFYLHGQLSKGSTNAWSDNGTVQGGGTAQLRETQTFQSINTTNGGYLIAGTYKGIVLYSNNTTVESYGTSSSYYVGYAHDEPQASQYPGTLRITHTG